MKPHTLLISAFSLLVVTFECQAQTLHRWNFDKHSDREGWTVPEHALGIVMGGSLWLPFTFEEKDPRKIAGAVHQIFGPDFGSTKAPKHTDMLSPRGLDLSTSESESAQLQVRMRVLNLSPVTDVFLRWRTKDQTDKFPDSRRLLPGSGNRDARIWRPN